MISEDFWQSAYYELGHIEFDRGAQLPYFDRINKMSSVNW